MDSAPTPRRLGEYVLLECKAASPRLKRWLAQQESVGRMVLIDELLEDAAADEFLAGVRAKAAVDHPLIGTVYEAASGEDGCFCALELLPGGTLGDRLRAGEPLKPARLVACLRHIAEANLYHESRGQATAEFGPDAVHLDEAGVVRLENLVLAGPRDPQQSARDVVRFGQALPPLVADGLPSATRLLTLLSWMRGEKLAAPLTWQAVHGYCEQIEQQLAETSPAMTPMTATVVRPRRFPVWAVAVGAGLVLILLWILIRPPGGRARAAAAGGLPEAVLIPAGEYPAPDGGTSGPLHEFLIATHEVTIDEYRAFLDALDLHVKNGRPGIYDHENQPTAKSGHQPDDWAALLQAARTRGSWRGMNVTRDCPVVGVDWWDAYAYAEWKQARLPTQEEWFAALRDGCEEPAKLTPGKWQPVTAETPDRTRSGLLGMAGSVAEWTRRPAVPADNPAGRPKWVIIGGSYLHQSNGALTREWVDDRDLRRPDLGFRVLPGQ